MDIAIRQEAGPHRIVANATQLNEVTGSRGRATWGFLDWSRGLSKGINVSRVAAFGLGVALASAARCHNSKGWVEGVILVTHDLGVVADIADRVIVMYAGRVVEQGTLDDIFYDPQHPYTWGLLGSITRIDADRSLRLPAIPGLPPSLMHAPEGCHFRPRCPHRFDKCTEIPPLESHRPDRPESKDRCFLSVEDKRRLRVVGEQIGLAAPEAVNA